MNARRIGAGGLALVALALGGGWIVTSEAASSQAGGEVRSIGNAVAVAGAHRESVSYSLDKTDVRPGDVVTVTITHHGLAVLGDLATSYDELPERRDSHNRPYVEGLATSRLGTIDQTRALCQASQDFLTKPPPLEVFRQAGGGSFTVEVTFTPPPGTENLHEYHGWRVIAGAPVLVAADADLAAIRFDRAGPADIRSDDAAEYWQQSGGPTVVVPDSVDELESRQVHDGRVTDCAAGDAPFRRTNADIGVIIGGLGDRVVTAFEVPALPPGHYAVFPRPFYGSAAWWTESVSPAVLRVGEGLPDAAGAARVRGLAEDLDARVRTLGERLIARSMAAPGVERFARVAGRSAVVAGVLGLTMLSLTPGADVRRRRAFVSLSAAGSLTLVVSPVLGRLFEGRIDGLTAGDAAAAAVGFSEALVALAPPTAKACAWIPWVGMASGPTTRCSGIAFVTAPLLVGACIYANLALGDVPGATAMVAAVAASAAVAGFAAIAWAIRSRTTAPRIAGFAATVLTAAGYAGHAFALDYRGLAELVPALTIGAAALAVLVPRRPRRTPHAATVTPAPAV